MMSRSTSEETWDLVFLWSALLVVSLAFGGFTMLYTAEDPILIDNSLTFENTKSGPVAVSCTDAYYHGKRTYPSHSSYRLHDIVIALRVPETYHNSRCRNFVVRIEYIYETGEVAATAWHPVTLKFKSHKSRLMHYLLSFLRIVPFLSGISSDAQAVELISNVFGASSTISCIRATLQKGGGYFRGGVGVPQVSAAHLLLQSQLPFIKRILWDWWKTMFVCISMLPFGIGVMCFRDVFIPKRKVR